MEAENKKIRDKKRKERNEVVRNLVTFVRKRDKRVEEHNKKLQEKAAENKRKTEEFQKKQREERRKMLEAGEQNGFNMNDMEDQLRQLEGQYSDDYVSEDEDISNGDIEEDVSDYDEEEQQLIDDLYCVACDKIFKTVGAKDNHETSRKHRENMEKLIEEMKAEEGDVSSNHDESNSEDDKVHPLVESKTKSKKKKKKQKQQNSPPPEKSDPELASIEEKNEEFSNDEETEAANKSSKKARRKQRKKVPDLKNEDFSEDDKVIPSFNIAQADSDEDSFKKPTGSKKKRASQSKKPAKGTATELVEKLHEEQTIVEIENDQETRSKVEKRKKVKGKQGNKMDPDADNVERGDLTCAQCR